MKKEFLDKIYEERSRVTTLLEELLKKQKEPQQACKSCDLTTGDSIKAKITVMREHLFSVNNIIADYIKIHNNP